MKIKIEQYVHSRRWHEDLKFSISEYRYISLSTNPSGCGSMIMYGYTELTKAAFNVIFKEIKKHIKEKTNTIDDFRINPLDIGIIITSIGDTYYRKWKPIFEENGFKQVKEYNNPRHGDGSKQSLYIYETKENEE